MARFNFCVTRIESSLKEQNVSICFSADVDPDSANEDSIYLLHRIDNKGSKAITPVDIVVDGKVVKLELKEWAVPGDEYVLIIQNNVCGIIDDPSYRLETLLLRNIKFKSEVTSDIQILSPVNFANVSSPLNISWKETGSKLENSYYLEIATENAFYNIIRKAFISSAQVKEIREKELADIEESASAQDIGSIGKLVAHKKKAEQKELNGILVMEYGELADPGQYYLRIRAQKEESGDYGRWSKVCTFIFHPTSEELASEDNQSSETIPTSSDSDLPVIEDLTGGSGITGTATAEKHLIPQYLEDLPLQFEIPLLQDIDITDATVVVRREPA